MKFLHIQLMSACSFSSLGSVDNQCCRPRAILDIIKSGENFRISTTRRMPKQGMCERCGYISSQVLSWNQLNSFYAYGTWIVKHSASAKVLHKQIVYLKNSPHSEE